MNGDSARDDLGQIPPSIRFRCTDAQIVRARFTCAHYADTADELRSFLDALGI